MNIHWLGKPGWKNKGFEIDHGLSGPYYFSLCIRQDDSDSCNYHLFVFNPAKGYRHLGGFGSIEEAKAKGMEWQDESAEITVGSK